MGWERDCASSVRDLTRVLNKAGGAGVAMMANLKNAKSMDGMAKVIELATHFDDEIGWVKRDIEKVIALCKMEMNERATMMQQVEGMHQEVHELYEEVQRGSLSNGDDRLYDNQILALENDVRQVKAMAQEVAINNISEGKGV